MTTNRELDALVAEKVMGWQKIAITTDLNATDYDQWATITEDGMYHIQAPINQWNPSKSILHAWPVVEKFDEWEMDKYPNGNVHCRAKMNNEWWVGKAPTAPEAICLAALKAVGVEI